ncbi:MAG: ribonuclease R [Candidatus Cloacimonetes bacterium]|nr:ribonuclease R [Candidatus Cloacimonadota bacterium]
MNQYEIAREINNLLNDNPEKKFAIKEIQDLLSLGKNQYKELVKTLRLMEKAGEIKRDRRLYFIKSVNEEQISGTFDATPLTKGFSYAFVIAENEDILIFAEDVMNAFHGDRVTVKIKYRRRGRLYGIIINIDERKNTKFIGTLIRYNNKYILSDISTKVHTDILIKDKGNAVEGDKVVAEISDWGNRERHILPVAKVIETLGKAGDPQVEVLGVIRQYDLPLDFPDAVMAEADTISTEINEDTISKRLDLRNILTFTIDPVSAKDYDDAISYKIYDGYSELYVHIADVAQYINLDSEIYKEAFNRGNSYYFPKRVIPMLPEKLSNNVCSLRPYEDKLTITVLTKFDENFEILHQSIHETVICSDARLSYEDVDCLFDGKEHDIPEEVAECLKKLRVLSAALTRKKIEKGYIFFDLPEIEYEFDEEGNLVNLGRSKETESHTLIENCMVLANEYVSELLSKKSSTNLYRIHEKPDDDRINDLRNLLKFYGLKLEYKKNYNLIIQNVLKSMPSYNYHRVFDKMILRRMKKAKYDTVNYGHFGLALEYYTHFTSPIRRLCDLIIHSLLKMTVFKSREGDISKNEMKRIAAQSSERELLADETERAVDDFNRLQFMKNKVGEDFTGIITNMNKNSIFVEFDKFPVTGVLKISQLGDDDYVFMEERMTVAAKKTGKIFKLTDEITVKVAQVTDDIYLGLISK